MNSTKETTDRNWGHCQHCKHFASPARVPLPAEEARCLHRELGKYDLAVFGASGWLGFDLRPGLGRGVEDPPEPVVTAT